MKSQFTHTLVIHLRSHWARHLFLILGSAMLLLAVVLLWQMPGRFAAAASWLRPSAPFAVITVNTTADDNAVNGNCTLREAILAANTNAAVDACAAGTTGADTISFNIGAGTPTINVVGSALPTITETVTIDGATGGAARVELNGAGAGSDANGLLLDHANNSIIKNLVINRFSAPATPEPNGNGIRITDCVGTVIENCYIGTNATGTAALPNANHGIYCNGSQNGDFRNNVLSGNGQEGVYISSQGSFLSQSNVIRGNLIGLNATGTAAVPNTGTGISFASTINNTIGGTTAADRNVISGNIGNGIHGSQGTVITGNYIGTDVTGTIGIGNGAYGVNTGDNNIVGGTTAGARNVISANIAGGATCLNGPGNTQILGNYIGTDAAGTAALSGQRYGVYIVGGPGNIIGGAAVGARNIISGNVTSNVEIRSGDNNQVLGNYIGLNAAGTAALGGARGVEVVERCANNIIGAPGAGNVIAGHTEYGIFIGNQINNNRIQGNIIGATPAGNFQAGFGNLQGIYIGGNDDLQNPLNGRNYIGGLAAGEGNLIAFNTLYGVNVEFNGIKISILSNSIFENGGLGIDLSPDGVTPNDAGDGDTGANNRQNFPVITQATTTGISFSLNSAASKTFTIEFFHNPTCDALGNGEGKTYIGQTTVTTDASGNTPIINYAATLPANVVVTATATDPDGNTSEFSSCRTVDARAIAGTVFEDVNYGGGAGRSLTASAGAPVANARVELYDGAGNFVAFTTTNASGQYTFGNLAAGNFTVRVVNGSIVSTRPGGAACPNCIPVQTFRTNAASGSPIAVMDHVGGEVPAKVDAGNGGTTLAALTTATTTAQSIAAVTVGGGNISGVDFGFNFDTIVNVNDAGQGSYRQFTLNAFSLGGEALLAQVGSRMDICILPTHQAISPELLPPGKETTIFMIANGQARPGLNTGYANLVGNNGVATILLTAFTTVRGDNTNIDGTTQTFNVGDTNSAVLGTGGMVGGENNIPLARLNGPEVQLLVTNPAVNYVIAVVGNHVTVRGLGVQGAGGGWDVYYADFNGSNNDFALVEQNVLGASAADFMHIGTERNQENLHLTSGSTGAIVRCNLMKDAGDMNLHLANSTFGDLVEGNEFHSTVGYPSNPDLQTGGAGIRMEGASQHTIKGNLFFGAQRGGIQLLTGSGGTGCTNNVIQDNTFTENSIGGVVVTSGNSQVPAAISQANRISRNSFYKNGGLAIDLNPLPLNSIYAPQEFVTPNDGLLNNLMPNQGVDYPVFTSVTLSGSTLAVQGYVGNTSVGPFNNTTVEVYVADNIPADQNGAILSGDGQNVPHGEGRYYIGACVTDPNSLFNCTITIPTNVTITPGTTQITATATRVLDTSEFGPNITVENPCRLQVTKSISATSVPDTQDPNVTIGETVVFKLKIALQEGTIPSLTVKDVIPPGMSVVSVDGRVTDGSSIPQASIPAPIITPTSAPCPNLGGTPVTLTYGQFTVPVNNDPNDNYFCILITATVCDQNANVGMDMNNQTMLTNRATAAIGPQPSMCMTNSNEVVLKVVEPNVAIHKSFAPPSVKEGEMTMIMLDVVNTGLSTAYNVIIEDLLPLGVFDTGSITSCGTVPAGFTFSTQVVGSDTAVSFTGGNLAPGEQLSLCFKVTVKRRCQNGEFLNTAKIKQAWTLPYSGCTPLCPRPAGATGLLGRDKSGGMDMAKLTIMPAMDCDCFGVTDPIGVKRPPAYNDMVLWLKFDEGAGDFANDSSAYSNDGMLMPATPNGPMHGPNLVQGSLMFDGTNDYVHVNDNATLNMGIGSLTIDAWINPAPETVTPTSGVRTIVDKRTFTFPGDATRPSGGTPVNNVSGYKLYLRNGFLALQLADGVNRNYETNTLAGLIPANTWTHVTAVADRTGAHQGIRLYVNGTLVPHVPNTLVTGNIDNTSPLYVGHGVPVDGDFFTGKIDELEIFKIELDEINGVLNESLIDGIVNAGSYGKCLPTPPSECCGKKPQFNNGNYPTFTGQVALVTCYAPGSLTDGSGASPVLAAIDLQNQAGALSNLLDQNWSSTSTPTTAFYHAASWSRDNLGDVFGITIDSAGNVYVASSGVYRRSTQDSHKGLAGPGGIYKINATTAAVTNFVTTSQTTTYIPFSNQIPNFDPLGTGGKLTQAPGLGNITFDCTRNPNMFYVSNFEDGLIYRINVNGLIQDSWDHGANLTLPVFDDGQPGMTAHDRRVWGLKTYNNRLYYSVWRNDVVELSGNPNEIWSVGLTSSGAFVSNSAKKEISVPNISILGTQQTWSSPVSDISFTPSGAMLLAERTMNGDPNVSAHGARVLEYIFNGSQWQLSSKVFEVGRGPTTPRPGINASGGVDFDRDPNGRVWATGDALHFGSGNFIYGLQGMPPNGTSGLLTMSKSEQQTLGQAVIFWY